MVFRVPDSRRIHRLGFVSLALLSGAMACSDPPRKSDSTVYLDVVDINAKVAPPPSPASKIGRLQVFSEPVGGTCKTNRYRGEEMAREIIYDADRPRRTIMLGIGRPPRMFPPITLQIIGTQSDGATNEQEMIVAGFTADGGIRFGTRTYSSTGAAPVSEKVPLSDSDGREAILFSRQLMTLCGDSAR